MFPSVGITQEIRTAWIQSDILLGQCKHLHVSSSCNATRFFRNPNNPRKEHPVHCGYCISWSSQQDMMEKLHPTYKICLDCFSSKIYTGHPFSSWWFPITDSSFWVQHFIESKIVQSPAFTPSHYLHPWCVCVRGASYYTIRRILYSDNCWTYRSVHSFLSGNGDWLWSLE